MKHKTPDWVAEEAADCRSALIVVEEAEGAIHPEVANLLCTLARLCVLQHRWHDARSAAQRAIRILNRLASLGSAEATAEMLACARQLLTAAQQRQDWCW